MNAPVQLEVNQAKPLDSSVAQASSSKWNAYLKLEFAKRLRGVRLINNEHEGPLYVQKAFYPEGPDCAHIYLLHPPGGLVTGDTLSINVRAQADTHALLTTPGAGRIYKARDQFGVQQQNLSFSVETGSTMEWFPLETILFPDSHARMNTRIDIDKDASFIGWDVTCFGLPANEIKFDVGSVNQSWQIWREGRIVFNERLVIDHTTKTEHAAGMMQGNAALRSQPVHGLMVAGPFSESEKELVEQEKEVVEANSFNSYGKANSKDSNIQTDKLENSDDGSLVDNRVANEQETLQQATKAEPEPDWGDAFSESGDTMDDDAKAGFDAELKNESGGTEEEPEPDWGDAFSESGDAMDDDAKAGFDAELKNESGGTEEEAEPDWGDAFSESGDTMDDDAKAGYESDLNKE